MNYYFPYEEKMIKEAIRSIPKKRVRKYCELHGYEYEGYRAVNYLVVYSKDTKKFFGISASRFLNNNYASGVILDGSERISKFTGKMIEKYGGYVENFKSPNIQLFAYSDYLKDYGNDGYKTLRKHISDSILKKINYAIMYQKYPNIKKIVEAGYYNLIDYIISSGEIDDTVKELIITDINDWQIDSECLNYLNNNDCRPIWWVYLHKINKKEILTCKQLQYLYENRINISNFYHLLKNNTQYSVSSLIDYIQRSVIYQGINASNIINNLSYYIDHGISYGLKIDFYPNDLWKVYKEVENIDNKFDKTEARSSWRNYHYRYEKRKAYSFSDENYCIKPENDIEIIDSEDKYFNQSHLLYLNSDNDFYWLSDKKTGKEIGLIDSKLFNNKNHLKYNTFKYGHTPLSLKEKRFLKKWQKYKNKIDLLSTGV